MGAVIRKRTINRELMTIIADISNLTPKKKRAGEKKEEKIYKIK